ncbi:MAG: carboxylesterase family protein [Corynebacterium sp.]|uniref:carboxylesterase family protein n=1 Tax=Corynebacterium sp. TaxID=1720 RepID=UPI003F9B37FE
MTAGTPTTSPLLATPSGTVSGSRRGDVAVFRAVPVAAPHTSDSTRFTAPRPAPAWDGTLDCSDTRDRCTMRASHTATVYAPAEPPRDPTLPVIVWIHGGRYEMGHGDEPWYDGGTLVRDGCVVVSVNYRKRFEGFLPLEGDPPESFRGVDDLIHALRWVRDTVGALGGDTSNTTVAGQSAGAGLIAWLLTDDRAADLFHRAVMMSPGLPRRGGAGRRLTARLALLAPGAPTAPITREYVGSLSPDQRQRAYRRFASVHSTDCAVGPYPLDVSRMRGIPVMVGTMHDEFVNFPFVVDVDRVLRTVLGTLRLPPVVDAWLLAPTMVVLGVPLRTIARWCRFAAGTAPVRPLGRTVGDRVIRRWASATAEALSNAGAPVWAYEFIGGRDGERAGELGHEAQHCGELPLLFDTLTVGRRDVEQACGPDAVQRLGGPDGTGALFRRAVLDFAAGRSPGWDRYTADGRTARIFDMSGEHRGGSAARTGNDPWRAVRTLLGRLY